MSSRPKPIELLQAEVCERFGVEPMSFDPISIAGVADDLALAVFPINGLRHLPVGTTSGWYIWAGGEPSAAPDYFKPTHQSHLNRMRPEVLPYLALPPGWRFQIGPGYEDVWFDPSILVA